MYVTWSEVKVYSHMINDSTAYCKAWIFRAHELSSKDFHDMDFSQMDKISCIIYMYMYILYMYGMNISRHEYLAFEEKDAKFAKNACFTVLLGARERCWSHQITPFCKIYPRYFQKVPALPHPTYINHT